MRRRDISVGLIASSVGAAATGRANAAPAGNSGAFAQTRERAGPLPVQSLARNGMRAPLG